MKVFEIIPTKEYFAGVALIAADNANIAISMWKQDSDENNNYWINGKCNCFENKELTANTDTPKVILDTIVDTYNW